MPSIYQGLSALRRELMNYVDSSVTRLFGFTFSSNSSPLGDGDEVEKDDYPVQGEKNQAQRPGRRIEPFGFRSRPPSKVRQLSIRVGSSNVFFIGIASDGGYGPTDLEAGESSIYSVEVERGMHLTKDGDNKLASKTGRTVQINGDTYSLIKTEEFFADLKDFMKAAKGGPSGSAAIVNGAGVPTGDFQTTALDLFDDLGNNEFLSTKAKNG